MQPCGMSRSSRCVEQRPEHIRTLQPIGDVQRTSLQLSDPPSEPLLRPRDVLLHIRVPSLLTMRPSHHVERSLANLRFIHAQMLLHQLPRPDLAPCQAPVVDDDATQFLDHLPVCVVLAQPGREEPRRLILRLGVADDRRFVLGRHLSQPRPDVGHPPVDAVPVE